MSKNQAKANRSTASKNANRATTRGLSPSSALGSGGSPYGPGGLYPPAPFPGHGGGFPPVYPGGGGGFPGSVPQPLPFPGGAGAGGYPPAGPPQGGPGGTGGGVGPQSPPPTFTPQKPAALGGVSALAVDPGSIRRCINRYVYIWQNNGDSYWMYLTHVGRHSISGYRWYGYGPLGFWLYFGLDSKRIEQFTCY